MSISDVNWKNELMPTLSRILLAIAGILLFVALFFPTWKMELSAPQYPEGLTLFMFPHKLAGDVNSINDLNHYIGMKTLHTEDFIEFTVLPYIIGFFGVLTLVSALIGRRRWALVTLILFAIFGVVALVDFYKWNYNYGHNLDPMAAIKIPGMAYQPPLIGFKQLLNFGVYSIPGTGGILMIISGLIMAFVVIKDFKFYKIFSKKKAAATILMAGMMVSFLSCSSNVAPRPIKVNADVCASCQMTIVDLKFATELVTDKGKQYVFDDIACMATFIKENKDMNVRQMYVANYLNDTEFLKVLSAFFIQGGNIQSPMGGNVAAFKTEAEAQQYAGQLNANVVSWKDLGL
jgi:copper chaperone NosL